MAVTWQLTKSHDFCKNYVMDFHLGTGNINSLFFMAKDIIYTLKLTVCYLGYTGEKYPPFPNQNVQFTASLPPSSPSLNQIILFYFFIHKFALHLYFMHNFIFVLVLFFLTSYSPRPKRSSSMWSFVWNYTVSNSYYCTTCTLKYILMYFVSTDMTIYSMDWNSQNSRFF